MTVALFVLSTAGLVLSITAGMLAAFHTCVLLSCFWHYNILYSRTGRVQYLQWACADLLRSALTVVILLLCLSAVCFIVDRMVYLAA